MNSQVSKFSPLNPSGVSLIKPTPTHPAAILGNIDQVVVNSITDDMIIRGYKGPPIKMLWNSKSKQWEKIDGRHRELACIKSGTTPEYERIKLEKDDTPERFVLRTHHMREIRRQTRLMYAIEMRPDLNITQVLKLAGYRQGGRASFTVSVLREVYAKHPSVWQDLKNSSGRRKMNFNQAAALVGMGEQGDSHYQNKSLRERFEEVSLLYKEAKREIIGYKKRISLLEKEAQDLTKDLEDAEQEIEELQAKLENK